MSQKGGPPDDGEPPNNGIPWEVDNILDTLEDEDHQDPKDLLDL